MELQKFMEDLTINLNIVYEINCLKSSFKNEMQLVDDIHEFQLSALRITITDTLNK